MPTRSSGGACADGRSAGAGNWLSAGFDRPELATLPLRHTQLGARSIEPRFADAAGGDYRLARPHPQIVGSGCALTDEALRALAGALFEYRAPQQAVPRTIAAAPDVGAAAWPGTVATAE